MLAPKIISIKQFTILNKYLVENSRASYLKKVEHLENNRMNFTIQKMLQQAYYNDIFNDKEWK